MTKAGQVLGFTAAFVISLSFSSAFCYGFSSLPSALPLSSRRSFPLSLSASFSESRKVGAAVGLRMSTGEDQGSNPLISGLGQGLAGIQNSVSKLGDEIAQEEAEGNKSGLFQGREKAMQEAATRDMKEEGDDEEEELPPIPEPVVYEGADFERQVWRMQVEKKGNWLSGNYVPGEIMIAFGVEENGTCEFGGDFLSKGKWYADDNSLYIDRAPLGALGPFSPFGRDTFRLSLTGWISDKLQMQVGGYASGYSMLFPAAIMGRVLLTRVAPVTEEEARRRIRQSAAVVERPELPAPAQGDADPSAGKRVKLIDISDDLTPEERLKKEAAEWVPSTVVSTPRAQPDFTKTLERLKGTVGDVAKNYMGDI